MRSIFEKRKREELENGEIEKDFVVLNSYRILKEKPLKIENRGGKLKIFGAISSTEYVVVHRVGINEFLKWFVNSGINSFEEKKMPEIKTAEKQVLQFQIGVCSTDWSKKFQKAPVIFQVELPAEIPTEQNLIVSLAAKVVRDIIKATNCYADFRYCVVIGDISAPLCYRIIQEINRWFKSHKIEIYHHNYEAF